MKVTDLKTAAGLYTRLTNLQGALEKMPLSAVSREVALCYDEQRLTRFTLDRGRFQELLEGEIAHVQNALKALGVHMEDNQ